MNGSNNIFPPQTGFYKVEVKKKSSPVEHNVGTLGISVGGLAHEGAKFEALCQWADVRFEKLVILVGDTLQRYNMMFAENLSEEFALHKTLKRGDQWLADNAGALRSLKNASIKRWESFRTRQDYIEKRDLVEKYYRENPDFQESVRQQSLSMLTRRYPDLAQDSERLERALVLSREYILEETAVFAMIEAEGQSLHIYPGSFMKIWDCFESRPAAGLEALSHRAYCSVDFSRNKSFVELPEKIAV